MGRVVDDAAERIGSLDACEVHLGPLVISCELVDEVGDGVIFLVGPVGEPELVGALAHLEGLAEGEASDPCGGHSVLEKKPVDQLAERDGGVEMFIAGDGREVDLPRGRLLADHEDRGELIGHDDFGSQHKRLHGNCFSSRGNPTKKNGNLKSICQPREIKKRPVLFWRIGTFLYLHFLNLEEVEFK